ncbi:EF-hand domain-containing protein [Chitinophaga cymbidii]|uniref:EF-hand domain-containing protein n=1 Tax=Chitinophaga cymbidii TaxID=1096750 RepID=A0A512RFB8_9BACT|nr:hypothetical protein [Chitinophaga cymbidii]GEP94403.1 hypothetical protein CCY01nite_06630 [Chitinophaga cymbidii]
MKKIKFFLVGSVILSLSLLFMSSNKITPDPCGEFYNAIDTDGNGSVSKAEWEAIIESPDFETVDGNQNGSISLGEFYVVCCTVYPDGCR